MATVVTAGLRCRGLFDFLSRYTVRGYVSSALSKLSLTSRAELAREVTRRQRDWPAA